MTAAPPMVDAVELVWRRVLQGGESWIAGSATATRFVVIGTGPNGNYMTESGRVPRCVDVCTSAPPAFVVCRYGIGCRIVGLELVGAQSKGGIVSIRRFEPTPLAWLTCRTPFCSHVPRGVEL
ncbi:MAG: hypothetical protein QXT77_08060 [Candidatus Methanomethylicaceae archaeon]